MSEQNSRNRRVTQAPPPPKHNVSGGSSSVPWRKGVDWSRWADMVAAPLWQAVALSLGLEPERVRNTMLSGDPFTFAPEDFKKRLALACNHLESDRLHPERATPDIRYSNLGLRDFAAWAESIGWKLPKRFPRSAPNRRPAATTARRGRPKGAGSYEQSDEVSLKNLRELLAKNPDMSVWAATGEIEIAGNGTPDSKRKRLANKYSEKFGR